MATSGVDRAEISADAVGNLVSDCGHSWMIGDVLAMWDVTIRIDGVRCWLLLLMFAIRTGNGELGTIM